ncbi:MAG: glycosyltransferase family 2 protein [Bariatricus sp.]|nr:glycosyltransferase family 2 protein [Bariatricus sp.]
MSKIYAGIVAYNPDLKRLEENVSSVRSQLSDVVVFDNGSDNIEGIQELVSNFANVILIKSEKNLGIATALNRLMQWGYQNGCDWMLSLDQDSVCEKDFVVRMEPYLTIERNLGVVAPVIVDRNVGVVGHNPKSKYAHVNTCITSGAFSKVSAWKRIGEYDESMFIDSVDFEYCYRMRKYGYGVIQVRDVQLLHELGRSQKKRFLFWKIKVTGHSAFRKYYIARNNIYYPLKHGMWLRVVRGNIRNIGMIVVTLLYENDKVRKIKSIYKGWKNGFKGKGA